MGVTSSQREQTRSRAWQILEGTVLRGQVVRYLPEACSAVALTFDDGPHPDYTPAVLDALRAAKVKATFFLIGERAERHPSLVGRILAEGHTIGCHTQTHPNLTELPFQGVWNECARGQQTLANLIGKKVRWFRPPMGWLKVVSSPAVVLNGMRLVYWNQDSLDYTGLNATEIVDTVQKLHLSAGDILLLHDDRAATAQALPQLLEQWSTIPTLPLDAIYP